MNETGAPLQQAIRRRDLAAVRTLLRQRPEPDGREVATAVRQRLAPALELMHEHGADLSAPATHTGQTPLHLAAHGGWTEGVALLLRLGCDPGRRDGSDRTPLAEALLHGHAEAAKRLLEAEPGAARGLALSSAVVRGRPRRPGAGARTAGRGGRPGAHGTGPGAGPALMETVSPSRAGRWSWRAVRRW